MWRVVKGSVMIGATTASMYQPAEQATTLLSAGASQLQSVTPLSEFVGLNFGAWNWIRAPRRGASGSASDSTP